MKLVLAPSKAAYERWRYENQVPRNESLYVASARDLMGRRYEDVVKLKDWALGRGASDVEHITDMLDAMQGRGDLC